MATAKNDHVAIGLIGTGFIGQVHSQMLRKIAKLTGGAVRIAAVHSHDAESAQAVAAHWPDARVAVSSDEIFADSAIDAVFICTPTRFHRELCLEAARARKHVFCEKPLAMNATGAAEIAAALDAAGVISQVGLVMRFAPVYTVIRAMFAKPDVGRMLAVTMRDDQGFPTRGVHSSGWRNDPSMTAGGALIEHSVHDLDMLSWMFGPVARIFCRTRNLSGAPGIEDFAALDLEFATGLHGQLTSVWHRMVGRPSNRHCEVFAENLFVAYEDLEGAGRLTFQRDGDKAESVMDPEEIARRFAAMIEAEHPHLARFRELYAAPYALEDATFILALQGRCSAYPPLAAGVAVQRMVERAYESARLGQPLPLS